MLALRPNCECCDKNLPPAAEVMNCTFECTFCRDCVDGKLGGVCPNRGENFASRPIPPAGKLQNYPPSTTCVFKPQGCGETAYAFVEPHAPRRRRKSLLAIPDTRH